MAGETNRLSLHIAGLVYHVPLDEKECGMFDGMLVHEPDNHHDPHAITVCKADGTCVGYVPQNKTWYIEKVIEGKEYSCSIVIYKLMDKGEFMGLEGKCTLSGANLSQIDMKDFRDASVDGRVVHPEKIIRREELDDRSVEGEYVVYLGSWRDAAMVKGYDEAMKLARKVEKAIRFWSRSAGSLAKEDDPWCMAKDVVLIVRQKNPWWHCGRVVLRMTTRQILECDLYNIEKKILKVDPRRYRHVSKENEDTVDYDWCSGGFSLWNVFSFFDDIVSTTPTISTPAPSPSSFMDWELFEAQIDSDDYFDFGW